MSHNIYRCKHNKQIGNGFICSDCFMEKSIDTKKEVYVQLDNPQNYPSVSNEVYTREKNNRNSYTDNSFIHRSLDIFHTDTNQPLHIHSYSDTSFGISTRGNRKIAQNNTNSHLHRSFVQPDNRFGNRFFEEKPTNTRNASTRDIGNQQAFTFQQKTQEIEKKENTFIPRFHNFL